MSLGENEKSSLLPTATFMLSKTHNPSKTNISQIYGQVIILKILIDYNQVFFITFYYPFDLKYATQFYNYRFKVIASIITYHKTKYQVNRVFLSQNQKVYKQIMPIILQLMVTKVHQNEGDENLNEEDVERVS